MKTSYDCEDLVCELKADINEKGDFDAYAFFDKIENNLVLTNYDFIVDEIPLSSKEIGKSIVKRMKASEILRLLEAQNSII